MLVDDFDLDDGQTWENVGNYVNTWGDWEQTERVCKSAHRWLRVVCKNLKIDDLPTGDRERWVNELAEELYRAIKTTKGDPADEVMDMIGHAVQDFIDEVGDYIEDADAMEREYKPSFL